MLDFLKMGKAKNAVKKIWLIYNLFYFILFCVCGDWVHEMSWVLLAFVSYLLNIINWEFKVLYLFSDNYHSRSGSIIFSYEKEKTSQGLSCQPLLYLQSSSYKLFLMLVYVHCYPRSYFSVNITSKCLNRILLQYFFIWILFSIQFKH